MLAPSTIEHIKGLMAQAAIVENDLEESFILGGGPGGQKTNKTSNVVRLKHSKSGVQIRFGEFRSREDNRWLARRALAETLLEQELNIKSAKQQLIEKKRRQKRRRSRRQKQRMLDDKHAHSEKKAARKSVEW